MVKRPLRMTLGLKELTDIYYQPHETVGIFTGPSLLFFVRILFAKSGKPERAISASTLALRLARAPETMIACIRIVSILPPPPALSFCMQGLSSLDALHSQRGRRRSLSSSSFRVSDHSRGSYRLKYSLDAGKQGCVNKFAV